MFLNIVCNNKNSQKFHENWKTPKPKKAGKWKSSISIETFCENGKIIRAWKTFTSMKKKFHKQRKKNYLCMGQFQEHVKVP